MDVQIVFPGEQLRTNLIRSKNQRNHVGLPQNSKGEEPDILQPGHSPIDF